MNVLSDLEFDQGSRFGVNEYAVTENIAMGGGLDTFDMDKGDCWVDVAYSSRDWGRWTRW